MNFFELFNIPLDLKVDKAKVAERFFDLQRLYHPDFHSNASVEEQESALELSSMANKAFQTFQSQDAIIKYILQLKGLLEEEEKYSLPPDFLMEVMELNEMKMDGADETELRQRTNRLQLSIYDAVKPYIENYVDGTTPETDLLRVKEYYYKKKYLDRLI